MAFSAAALPFLLYAVMGGALLVVVMRRIQSGLSAPDEKSWMVTRCLVASALAAVIIDNLRCFAGGGWVDTEEPPPFAMSIYGLMLGHMVFVPLQILPQIEFCFAASTAKCTYFGLPMTNHMHKTILRLLGVALCFIFALTGVVNCLARARAAQKLGLVRSGMFGVIQFKMPTMQRAEELGYQTFGPELAGVMAFIWTATFAGMYIAKETKAYFYLVLQFAGLLGQALGPVLDKPTGGAYFFYASNFFEIVSFFAMVLCDLRFFVKWRDVHNASLASRSSGISLPLARSRGSLVLPAGF